VGVTQLRLVTEDSDDPVALPAPLVEPASSAIELDDPDAGLKSTLDDIASDLRQVGTVRRDVRSWALTSAAVSSAVTVSAVAAMLFVFMPRAAPAAVIMLPLAVPSAPKPMEPPALAPVAVAAVAAKAATERVAAVAEPEPAAEEPISDADLAVRGALRLLWANHAKQAMARLEPVLDANPDHVGALTVQALALYDLHRDGQARKVVKRALKLDPGHPMANLLRGFMAQVEHDVPSALHHYDKYLRRRPHGAFAEELAHVRSTLTPSPANEAPHE